MKNYLLSLTDYEIKSYLLSYLQLTNWSNVHNDLYLDKLEDIIVERGKNEAVITLYFKHLYKFDIHDKYVTVDSATGMKDIDVCQVFYVNSYKVSGYNLYNNQVDKFLYNNKKNGRIEDDLTKYWNYRLFKKFGDEYLVNLRKYKTKVIKKEYEQERNKIDKHIQTITEKLEM